jgi:hypothetical protein
MRCVLDSTTEPSPITEDTRIVFNKELFSLEQIPCVQNDPEEAANRKLYVYVDSKFSITKRMLDAKDLGILKP